MSDGFQNWYPGQPDNWGSKEECMVMNNKGKWLDVNCNLSRYVICERCLTCKVNSISQKTNEKESKYLSNFYPLHTVFLFFCILRLEKP